MDSNKTSEGEACSGPTKHREILIQHNGKKQDGNDILRSNTGMKDKRERESAVNERTVGRTCNQNEQHQVGQDNSKMDIQRRKTSKRKLVAVNG